MSKLSLKDKKAVIRNIKLHKKQMFPERGGGNRLARELGISPQLLSQWTNGARFPTTEKLIALAEVFGITIQELCGRERADVLDAELNFYDAVIMLSEQLKKKGKIKKNDKSLNTVKRFIESMLEGNSQ